MDVDGEGGGGLKSFATMALGITETLCGSSAALRTVFSFEV